MSLEVTRESYELFLRLGAGFVVRGAHYRELETIRDGDTVLRVVEGPAQPLEAGGAPLQAILGQATTALVGQVAALEAEREMLLARIEELEAYVPPPLVPVNSVPMRAARRALIEAGLFAAVDAAIKAIPGISGDLARTDWEYSETLRRDHPLLAQLGPVIGITEEQIDELFEAARAIK